MAEALAYVHPSAIVDEGVEVGDGTKIWHFVHVSTGARIGQGCSLGQNVYIGNDVRIGDRVRIQNNVSVYTGVEVADDAFLGPSCVFTNVINPRSEVNRKQAYLRTFVGHGASIGANATIVCGHDLGEYAFVGAGAVITRSVPSYALVVGNPARQLGWMCRCGERLDAEVSPPSPLEVRCGECSAQYRVADGVCTPVSSD